MEDSMPDGCVTICCTEITKFVVHTDASLTSCYAELAALDGDALDDAQQCLGVKYNPHGIMSDPHVRTFYRPHSHMIRDWMHTCVSGGVANVQAARLLFELKRHGIPYTMVGTFIEGFNLPHRHGKTTANWVSKNRIGTKAKSLGAFASDMMSLIPLLSCFLHDTLDDNHAMADHAKCWHLLHHIIGILSFGPDDAMAHIGQLTDIIDTWGQLFVRLYGREHVKPKFHHLFVHMVDDMRRVGKLLSFFVAERKHRVTKRAALYVFRHVDNTVAYDLLNRQCEDFSDPNT
jgi:hypothetical protein